MNIPIYTADPAYNEIVFGKIQNHHAAQMQQIQQQYERELQECNMLVQSLQQSLAARGLREKTREIVEGPGGVLYLMTMDSEGRGVSVIFADIVVKDVTILYVSGGESQLLVQLFNPSQQSCASVKISTSELGGKGLYNLLLGVGVKFYYSGSPALIAQLVNQFFSGKISTAERINLPLEAGWYIIENQAKFYCGNRCPWESYIAGLPIGAKKLEIQDYGSLEKSEIVKRWWSLYFSILPVRKSVFVSLLTHSVMIFSLLRALGYTEFKPIVLIGSESAGTRLAKTFFPIFNRGTRMVFSTDVNGAVLKNGLKESTGDSILLVNRPSKTAYSEKRISATFDFLIEQTHGICREEKECSNAVPVIVSSTFPIQIDAQDVLTLEFQEGEINAQQLDYALRNGGVYGDYVATLADYIENGLPYLIGNFNTVFSAEIENGRELGFEEFTEVYALLSSVLWLMRRFLSDLCGVNEAAILAEAEAILKDQIGSMAENADTTGLSEIFSTAIKKAVESKGIHFQNRFQITAFDDENIVAYDDNYYYFSESSIRRILDSEVGRIPLCRFLNALYDEGALKKDTGSTNTFTTKVVLKSRQKTERKRRVAIQREFFAVPGELDLLLMGGQNDD